MTADDLRSEISIGIESIDNVLEKLSALYGDVKKRRPTVREKTAAGSFMAQFYSGVENILKRISVYHEVPLPSGRMWQVDLFRRFCVPSHRPLPELFDDLLASGFSPYRRFRHVFHHSYGFELEWERMKEGIERAPEIFTCFKEKILNYLCGLGDKKCGK